MLYVSTYDFSISRSSNSINILIWTIWFQTNGWYSSDGALITKKEFIILIINIDHPCFLTLKSVLKFVIFTKRYRNRPGKRQSQLFYNLNEPKCFPRIIYD